MLLWPTVCVAVWSAEQFRLQCTIECPQRQCIENDVNYVSHIYLASEGSLMCHSMQNSSFWRRIFPGNSCTSTDKQTQNHREKIQKKTTQKLTLYTKYSYNQIIFDGKPSTGMPPPEKCIFANVDCDLDRWPQNLISSSLSPIAPKL